MKGHSLRQLPEQCRICLPDLNQTVLRLVRKLLATGNEVVDPVTAVQFVAGAGDLRTEGRDYELDLREARGRRWRLADSRGLATCSVPGWSGAAGAKADILRSIQMFDDRFTLGGL